ncbi:hypothetical protein K6L44_06645 [Gluconacetobacter entanii]|uniref:hypothetical protein n=1 Tax=Gluconacetobacter entanii TaxID=108528 RepID=UPI001C935C7B|nr:hypothetical protein [Gluconacetobacter entanii]MBY4639680.1 hypothetical protein [Gluconacetobacter entanii]MCW4579194.1 hypothetical protein [Gluconacetobacter entanii]MCW4582584.1 hypothetical protein [Gluconacetobacter entanii]MCW4585967.1 hypothetical protein [Gluconacetobacter entanii]
MTRHDQNERDRALILRRIAWANGDDRALIVRADAPRAQHTTAMPPFGVWFLPDGSSVPAGRV